MRSNNRWAEVTIATLLFIANGRVLFNNCANQE